MKAEQVAPVTPVRRFTSKERRLSETSEGTAVTFLSPGTASGTPMTASTALDSAGLISYNGTVLEWEACEGDSQLSKGVLPHNDVMLDLHGHTSEHQMRLDSQHATSRQMTSGFLQFSPSLMVETLGVLQADSDEEGNGNADSWDSNNDILARFGLNALGPLEEDSLVAFVNTINALTGAETLLDKVDETASSLGKAQSFHPPKTNRKGNRVAVSQPETNPVASEVMEEAKEQDRLRNTMVPPGRGQTRSGIRILSSRISRVAADAPGLDQNTPHLPEVAPVQEQPDHTLTCNDVDQLPCRHELRTIPESGGDDNLRAIPRAERRNSQSSSLGKRGDTPRQADNVQVPKVDNLSETTKQKSALPSGKHKSVKDQANAKTGKIVGGLFKKVFANHLQSDFEKDLIDAIEKRPHTTSLRADPIEEASRYGTTTEVLPGAHRCLVASSVPRTLSLQSSLSTNSSSQSLLSMQSSDQSVQRSQSLNSATGQHSVRVSQPRSLLSGRSSATPTTKFSTRYSNPKYGKRSLDVVDNNPAVDADDLGSLPSASQSLPSMQSSALQAPSMQSSVLQPPSIQPSVVHTPSIQSTIMHTSSIRSSAINTPFVSPRTGRSRMMAPK